MIATMLDGLAERAKRLCLKRGWSLEWEARGCYLHLEASELVESLRGKGKGTPAEEAADVLFVLLSIMGGHGIGAQAVLDELARKMAGVEAGTIGREHGA